MDTAAKLSFAQPDNYSILPKDRRRAKCLLHTRLEVETQKTTNASVMVLKDCTYLLLLTGK
jgi:hypothetical protein